MKRQQCALCKSIKSRGKTTKKAANYFFTDKEIAINHARVHWNQLKTFNGEGISEAGIFEKCFPLAKVVKSKKPPEISSAKLLVNKCRGIFERQSTTPRVRCNVCQTDVHAYNRGHLQTHRIVEHASTHVVVDLFECKHCDGKFKTKNRIRSHLKQTHKIRALNDEFRDKTSGYTGHILIALTRCFEGSKQLNASNGYAEAIKAQTRIRGQMNRSTDLNTKRQVFCYNLITKSVDRNRKVNCNECSKKISIRGVGNCVSTGFALNHAAVHLRKNLFRCKVCSKMFHNCAYVRRHIKMKHKVSAKNNYKCVADEFHEEIMGMVKKCFGREAPQGGE